jgi:hypothetical protein
MLSYSVIRMRRGYSLTMMKNPYIPSLLPYLNVSYWHKADMAITLNDICFRG